MKKILLTIAALLTVSFVFAQEKYQRSSLHMVLLTTDEPLTNDPSVEPLVNQAWQNYPFPNNYNQHEIAFKTGHAGKPKGGFLAMITKYDGNLPTTVAELKDLKESLNGGKEYMASLKEKVDGFIESENIARQLVMKWFNIQPDGTADVKLLLERSAFNMSSSEISTAAATQTGAQELVNQTADELINTTFVAFTKMDFYLNEPVAKFWKNFAITIAKLSPDPTGMAVPAATAAAEKAYEMTKDGYTAKTSTLLYKLVWNDSIQALLYDAWSSDKIDMNKFNAIHFEMEYLGDDDCRVSSGASSSFMGKQKSKDDLVNTTITRCLNKTFVQLQKSYEVFRPVAPIISTNPLMADMGTKEGLEGGEKFEILTRTQDPKTGKMGYKSIGTVKVDKKGVWDNNYNMVDGKVEITPSPQQTSDGRNGTVLSKNGKAMVGMVVRQVGSKKKK